MLWVSWILAAVAALTQIRSNMCVNQLHTGKTHFSFAKSLNLPLLLRHHESVVQIWLCWSSSSAELYLSYGLVHTDLMTWGSGA